MTGGVAVYDRAEVARVALAASGSMSLAVAEHFGVSRTLASSLIHRARKDGHVIPSDLANPGTGALYDRAEIARIALANPGRMSATVADRFAVSRSHASNLIDAARKVGFDIPTERAMPETRVVERVPSFSHLRLACSCGWSCAVLNGGATMTRHTLKEHGRPPTPAERIPQDVRKVAA